MSRSQSPFREEQIRVALEELEADGCFVFASAHAQFRRETDVEVRILHHRGAVAEIRHHLEVEIARNTAAPGGTDFADRECIRHRMLRIVDREAAVLLRDKAEEQPVIARRRLDEKALLKARLQRRGCRRRRRLRGGRLRARRRTVERKEKRSCEKKMRRTRHQRPPGR